jgi:ribokinase
LDKILVVGSLNMDLVALAPRLPAAGETLAGGSYFMTPGGKGANQACAASLMGGAVHMMGKVGNDDFGRRLIASLANARCNVSAISTSDDPSGVAMITVSEQGENCIVIIAGANGSYSPADVEAAMPNFEDAKVLLLQLETPIETVVAAAKEAKRRGATVILDPAPAPNLRDLAALLPNVDIITPNEIEAARLADRDGEDLSLEEATVIARVIRERGIPTVIVKLGAKGCLLADSRGEIAIPAPRVNAVDSTAAGDVFNGILAVALSQGRSLVFACRLAVSGASLSVTKLGAQSSMPTRAELEAFQATQ